MMLRLSSMGAEDGTCGWTGSHGGVRDADRHVIPPWSSRASWRCSLDDARSRVVRRAVLMGAFPEGAVMMW